MTDARHVPPPPDRSLPAAVAAFPRPLAALLAATLAFQWAAMPWLFALAVTCAAALLALGAYLEWQDDGREAGDH